MPEAHLSEDTDFATQMKSLAAEAKQQMDVRVPRKAAPSLIQMLHPMVVGIEALSRATAENTAALEKLQAGTAEKENLSALPLLMANVQQSLDSKNTVNQKLFDALYQELTSYKDAALSEALHKPIIRDLIVLYDDFSEIQRQVDGFVEEHKKREEIPENELPLLHYIGNLGRNIDHAVASLMDLLARLDVIPVESSNAKIDKATQRAVGVELTENEAEDGDILTRVKLGFTWRNRTFRPEEVIVKKWNSGLLVAMK